MQLVKALSVSSIIISIYALFQFFGFDFIRWADSVFAMKRAFSSLGNPINLAIYLTLIIPINVYFAFYEKKALFIIAALLSLIAIIVTFSMGPWLGILGAFLVAVFLNRKEVLKSKKILFGLIAIVLAVSILIAFLATADFKTRFNQVIQGQATFNSRVLIWKSALPGLIQRPLLGRGPETFYLSFTQNISPQYERMVSRRTLTDRAHNEPIQIGLTMGLIGLVAYLGLIFTLLYEAGVSLRKNQTSFYSHLLKAVLPGVVGYLVSMQTFFGSIDVSPLFWAELALLAVSSYKILGIERKSYHLKMRSLNPSLSSICLGVLIVVMSLPLTYGLRLTFADYYYRQAKLAFGAQYHDDSFYYFKKASALTPHITFYRDEYGKALLEASVKSKDKTQLKKAIDIFDSLNRYSPMSSFYYLDSGHAYLEYYRLWPEKRYLHLAEQKFSKGLELDENFSQMRLELAQVQNFLNEKKSAKANLERVSQTRPEIIPADPKKDQQEMLTR